MPGDDLLGHIESVEGEEPSEEFLESLSQRLNAALADQPGPSNPEEEIYVVDLEVRDDSRQRQWWKSRGLMLSASAAIVLAVVLAAAIWLGDAEGDSESGEVAAVPETTDPTPQTDPPATSSTTTESSVVEEGGTDGDELMAVGEAWLQSVVDNDETTFRALHAADARVTNTVIGWGPVELVSSGRLDEPDVATLYFGGFGALHTSLETRGTRGPSYGAWCPHARSNQGKECVGGGLRCHQMCPAAVESAVNGP